MKESSEGQAGRPTFRSMRARGLKIAMLRAVDAIAREGTLIKAAATLGISQPALTRTLQQTERILAARLFERTPSGMRPTDAGDALATSARRIFAELERLGNDLDGLETARLGTLAVGVLPVAAAGLMPHVLTTLRRKHADVHVRLIQDTTEGLLPLLASGDIDIVVGRLYPRRDRDGFERQPLWSEPISIYARAAHPILSETDPMAADIERFGLVLPSVSQGLSTDIEEYLVSIGLSGRTAMRVNSHAVIREVVHESDMLTAMPRLMLIGDQRRGTIGQVRLTDPVPRRQSGIITSPDRDLPAAGAAFLAALHEELDHLAAEGLIMLDQQPL